MASSRISEFLDHAVYHFGLGSKSGRGPSNTSYIEVTAQASKDKLGVKGDDPEVWLAPEVVDPITFLAPDSRSTARELSSVAPCITFVIGQYGLGKTELMFQLCARLLKSRASQPLPINLAQCRAEAHRLEGTEPLSQRELSKLLFCRLRLGDDASVVEAIWQRIRAGEVTLILDGVDELLGNWAQLKRLVSSVTSVLTEKGEVKALAARVVFTIRLELLMALAEEDGSDLSHTVEQTAAHRGLNRDAIHTYFLQLGFLLDSHIEAYLSSHIANVTETINELRSNAALLDVLRRPLLLRIYVVVRSRAGSLGGVETPVHLVQKFVESAASDESLLLDQRMIAGERWNIERLAEASLDLYARGKNELGQDEIAAIFGDGDDASGALLSIHKLPFLQLPGDHARTGLVQFSHRIFFEYFVALGMHLRHRSQDFNEFDSLVLNVDMRRLLRDLMGEKIWFKRTMRSYALAPNQHAEWRLTGNRRDFDDLEQHRRVLLQSMTEPEEFAKVELKKLEIEASVYWFVNNQAGLHPRYLVYNYEAVAVYLAHQRWTDTARAIRRQFEVLIRNRFRDALVELEQGPEPVREGWELLVERILSIGRRLRSDWVADVSIDWKLIHDEHCRGRIAAIQKEIKDSVF